MVLAQTVKGWTLGPGVEARNITHQAKKLSEQELRIFRDRLELPIPDEQAQGRALLPARAGLAGAALHRRAPGGTWRAVAAAGGRAASRWTCPPQEVFGSFDAGSGTQEASTTMAFARLMRDLIRDKGIGKRIVPIIPDEARTFGMDPLFKEVGIYTALGQRYDPVDSNLVLSYREATDGQVLEEGITEAGSSASFQAAGTAYATHGEPMIPFYIFYSMFGFQRTGDQFWAFADARGRGFLLGGTAGRTTLNGEGLQHEDGHTLVLASTVPNGTGLRPCVRLRERGHHPGRHPPDARRRTRGPAVLHRAVQREPRDARSAGGPHGRGHRARPVPLPGGAGAAARSRRGPPSCRVARSCSRRCGAQAILAERYGVAAEVWSATSYQLLRNQALDVDRWNLMHPGQTPRTPLVTELLGEAAGSGPIVAVSDWIRAWPDIDLALDPGRRVDAAWAPTASAEATPARRCAGSSASTRRTSWPRCCPSWPAAARSPWRPPGKRWRDGETHREAPDQADDVLPGVVDVCERAGKDDGAHRLVAEEDRRSDPDERSLCRPLDGTDTWARICVSRPLVIL